MKIKQFVHIIFSNADERDLEMSGKVVSSRVETDPRKKFENADKKEKKHSCKSRGFLL